MTQLYHDKENNVLYITKKPQEKQKMKGFIIYVADNLEELEDIKAGRTQPNKISPILAPDEQKALEVITNQGKIAISIINYEYLKLQVELIETLSKQSNIDILVENEMKIEFKD